MYFTAFIDWFIHDKLKINSEDLNRARVFIGFTLALSIGVVIFSFVYFGLGASQGGIAVVLGGVMFLLSTFVVKYSGAIRMAAYQLVGSFFVLIAMLSYMDGGFTSPPAPWFAAVALSAVLVISIKAGLFFMLAAAALLTVFYIVELTGFVFPVMLIDTEGRKLFMLSSNTGLGAMITAFGIVFSLTISKMLVKIKESSALIDSNMKGLKGMVRELELVMADITSGDFSRRLEISGDSNEIIELKTRLNNPIGMLTTIIEKVVEASGKVNTGSRDLSQSAQGLSAGSSEQAASLEEISSSLAEVEQTAEHNNESAQTARSMIEKAIESVKTGNGNMTDLLTAMNEISETSQQVTGVIKTIDEIAFQTNLLALNAAVEAARAGKYGKGFAVVADEVRNLASRSAEAAKSTTELIGSSVKNVEEGVNKSNLTADSFKLISEEVEKVNNIVLDIASASQQQNQGIREINNGLNQVNRVVQDNTAIAEQTASTADELLTQANELEGIVSSFNSPKSELSPKLLVSNNLDN